MRFFAKWSDYKVIKQRDPDVTMYKYSSGAKILKKPYDFALTFDGVNTAVIFYKNTRVGLVKSKPVIFPGALNPEDYDLYDFFNMVSKKIEEAKNEK